MAVIYGYLISGIHIKIFLEQMTITDHLSDCFCSFCDWYLFNPITLIPSTKYLFSRVGILIQLK